MTIGDCAGVWHAQNYLHCIHAGELSIRAIRETVAGLQSALSPLLLICACWVLKVVEKNPLHGSDTLIFGATVVGEYQKMWR